MSNKAQVTRVSKPMAAALFAFLICIQGCTTVIDELRSPDPKDRVRAATWLWTHEYPNDTELLIAALKDEHFRVREIAALALGARKDARAIEPLIATLKSETWGTVIDAVCIALSKINDPRTVQALLEALNDEDFQVRESAVTALGDPRGYARRCLDLDIVKLLHVALRDKHPEVRAAAAWRLGHLRDRRSVEPLIADLKDEDVGVRGYAAHALQNIPDTRAIEPLIEALAGEWTGEWLLKGRNDEAYVPLIKWTIARALSKIGAPAVEPLIAALRHENVGIRNGVACALGYIGEPRAERRLILALEEENLEIIAAAHEFFIRKGVPGSERLLIEALEKHGDKDMASNFRFCRNDELERAGHKWARSYGYTSFYAGHTAPDPMWGSDR